MTGFWLLAWLLSSTPPVEAWSGWMIALVVCAITEFLAVL